MEIRLWGVRGSIPAPLSNEEYRQKVTGILQAAIDHGLSYKEQIPTFLDSLPPGLGRLVGGDTTCVEITNDAGNRLIIDAGTGLRRLGYKLMAEGYGKGGREIHFCMTHTHWDHILSWQFFIPGYIPGNTVTFHSTIENLHERMRRNQHPEHFPLEFDKMPSTRGFNLLKFGMENETEINGFRVACIPLRHPGGSTGYRIAADGKVFIFATDVEISGDEILELKREHRDFFLNADMLVMDGQYSLEEAFFKFDWGHTTPSICVNFAASFNIKKVVITHHEPAYSDAKLETLMGEALEVAHNIGVEGVEVYLGRESDVFRL